MNDGLSMPGSGYPSYSEVAKELLKLIVFPVAVHHV